MNQLARPTAQETQRVHDSVASIEECPVCLNIFERTIIKKTYSDVVVPANETAGTRSKTVQAYNATYEFASPLCSPCAEAKLLLWDTLINLRQDRCGSMTGEKILYRVFKRFDPPTARIPTEGIALEEYL